MESKIIEVKIEKIDIQLTNQEEVTFRNMLNELDTIYHNTSATNTDFNVIARLRNAMIDFKNRYLVKS